MLLSFISKQKSKFPCLIPFIPLFYYNKLDKLSTSLLGKTYYKDAKGNDAIRNNTTVYKYIFERSDINYKESTGRIDYMKFKAVGNTKNWELNVK
ncbi:MAG: hypothetical protein OSJ63_08305 [Bacilli bacterium]|nr:hypothetical protein [Bacilli bacterium]